MKKGTRWVAGGMAIRTEVSHRVWNEEKKEKGYNRRAGRESRGAQESLMEAGEASQ